MYHNPVLSCSKPKFCYLKLLLFLIFNFFSVVIQRPHTGAKRAKSSSAICVYCVYLNLFVDKTMKIQLIKVIKTKKKKQFLSKSSSSLELGSYVCA